MDCPKEGRRDLRTQTPIIPSRQRSWRYNPDTDKASCDDERLRELFPLGWEYERTILVRKPHQYADEIGPRWATLKSMNPPVYVAS
jgi:hypothetical protein